MEDSILTKILAEVSAAGNYGESETRTRTIVNELQTLLNKRVVFYFASELGVDDGSLITDEDAFVIENLLSVPTEKNDLVLVLHSNGGFAISAERIINVCKNYCQKRGSGNKFSVLVPKRAKSAATILSLGADNTYLRDTAELGPVDPQLPVTDKAGNRTYSPAYLHVDAVENLIPSHLPFPWRRFLNTSGNGKDLTRLPVAAIINLITQCNYALYVTAKNDLGLSDSIIEKIAEEKIKRNSRIAQEDFQIFKDPHLTKSHGRLIGLKDLEDNSLFNEGIISGINSLCPTTAETASLDTLLWELYVRKRRLLNDAGNNVVKTIETPEEFFSISGKKVGQT